MNMNDETPGASAGEPIHYNPDPFGPPLCGRLGVEDATKPYMVHSEPPSVTCDLCLLAAFPWLDRIKADALAPVMDWLCDSGFGFDFWTPMRPAPFSVYDLAAAYHRQDPSEDIEVWADTLLAETGQKYAEDAR